MTFAAAAAWCASRAPRRLAATTANCRGHLPRYKVVVDAEDRACPCCGHALHAIGELRTEQLDMVPSQLRVRVARRPRYTCHGCEGVVVIASAPGCPVDSGMVTEALVAHVLVSKFADVLPLYRQAQMLERQGIKLDRSTLANWGSRACWWLTPLYELMLGTVLGSAKVFADDTALPALDPGRGRTETGQLWCYAVDDLPWKGPGHPTPRARMPTWNRSVSPMRLKGASRRRRRWTESRGSRTGWRRRSPGNGCMPSGGAAQDGRSGSTASGCRSTTGRAAIS